MTSGYPVSSLFIKYPQINIQSDSSIADTSLWTGPRTLDSLPEFIAKGIGYLRGLLSTHLCPSSLVLPTLRVRLAQRPKSNAAPTLIYIAGAALRVADVVSLHAVCPRRNLIFLQTRVLKARKLRGDRGGEIAKLFARHIKLDEHVTYLKRTKIGAAVGTSGRLGKLLEIGRPESCGFFHTLVHILVRRFVRNCTHTHYRGHIIS
jgi:protein CMS1